MKLQTEEKLETTTGFDVRLNQKDHRFDRLNPLIYMHALISWSAKNGVALGREELEVRSTSKLTIMNGGKMEPGATVNMLFRKEIWGGTIQSLHGT